MNRLLQPAIRNSLLLFAGCFLFHLAGTWSLPLIDRDEPRFAEASREMLARGDYVIPYFNNTYRFDKPPLTYWFQVVSYRIFGQTDFAARFPSAVAAAATALVLLLWGRRNQSERIGLMAALIFTLSLQVFVHAKAAVADMWLVFFVTVAHLAGWELLRGHRNGNNPGEKIHTTRWSVWWAFYLALGFAFLAKGPIGWTPLLAVLVAARFFPGESIGRRFAFARGILFLLLLVSLWGIPALLWTRGEFFQIGIGRHVVARSLVSMEGHGASSFGLYLLTLPFFFVTLFVSFFPWSIKLPFLARSLRRHRDSLDLYLLVGAGILFLIFTLVKTKLPHYTLPAFPLLALLLARHWPAGSDVLFRRIALGTAAVLLALALIAPPLARSHFPSLQLLQAAKAELRSGMEFGAVGYQEPSLVWYFRRYVTGWFTPLKRGRAVEFMNQAGPRFIILPTALAQELYPTPPLPWKTFRVAGFNVVKGQRVDLTLLLKPE